MNSPKLVCRYDPALIDRLEGRTLVLRVGSGDAIAPAAAHAECRGNRVLQFVVETGRPLDTLVPGGDWPGFRLTVAAPAFGQFRLVAPKIELFRRLGLEVALPASRRHDVVGLQLLSSLGVPGRTVLRPGATDWESLTDLMTYAILGRVPHAPIEPFAGLLTQDDRAGGACLGNGDFDDPGEYLHVGPSGQLALSRSELERQAFLEERCEEADAPGVTSARRERANAWRSFFLSRAACAYCPGWKMCHGRFAAERAANPGCAAFFTELASVAGQWRQDRRAVSSRSPWSR